MSTLELSFIVMVGVVVGIGSLVGLYVVARAYFGGRNTYKPLRRANSNSKPSGQ